MHQWLASSGYDAKASIYPVFLFFFQINNLIHIKCYSNVSCLLMSMPIAFSLRARFSKIFIIIMTMNEDNWNYTSNLNVRERILTVAEKAEWIISPVHLEYTDISVECGTSTIGLAIQICPVVYTGYNASLLFLNHLFDNPECKGTLDESVTPPVVRFSFPINKTNACGSTFVVSSKFYRSHCHSGEWWTFSQGNLFFVSLCLTSH